MTSAIPATPMGKRAAISLGLCVYFLIVYCGTEAIAAMRTSVPSLYFSWERRFPFVSAEIIPYLSIDLFFVVAPLLLRTDRQLRIHSLRVITAIGVAGVIFVLFPLKFAFPRPTVSGMLGNVFAQFWRADLPLNQCPSLHIALLLIVGDIVVRQSHGIIRPMLLAWFALIAASPLLVYQHHLVDLLGGFALGLLCLHLIRDEDPRPAFEPNRRVGLYYFLGGMGSLIVCVYFGKIAWPLWWPTFSLLLLSAGYWFIGPSLYAKRDGRLPIASWLLLWPTLIGQYLSLRWYARQCTAHDSITDQVWIGRRFSESEAVLARRAGVAAVIDLTSEFDEPHSFRTGHYLQLSTLDLTAPTPEQIAQAIAFIAAHESTSLVYIHCKAGYSRTAVIAAAYLIATGRANSANEAIAQLKKARPTMIIRPEAQRAIERFSKNRAARARN